VELRGLEPLTPTPQAVMIAFGAVHRRSVSPMSCEFDRSECRRTAANGVNCNHNFNNWSAVDRGHVGLIVPLPRGGLEVVQSVDLDPE
jgi:hypothetical protein